MSIYTYTYIYIYIYTYMYNLREFGFKLPLSLPLCVGGGCFPRIWGRTSRNLGRSNARDPRTRSMFSPFWVKSDALLAVWRTRALQTTGFVDSIGPWVPESSKVSVFTMVSACALSKTMTKPSRNSNSCTRNGTFEFLAAFLQCFQQTL